LLHETLHDGEHAIVTLRCDGFNRTHPALSSTVMRRLICLMFAAALASCAGHVPAPGPLPAVSTQSAPPPQPSLPVPAPSPKPTAAALPLTVGTFDTLPGWPGRSPDRARAAFLTSCPALERRDDASGLTRAGDWDAACAAAAQLGDARVFFEAAFAPVMVGQGVGLNTGYFELTLAGSRTRDVANAYPLYRVPGDLIDVDLGQFAPTLAGKHVRGRVDGARLVPYHDRASIDDGALAGRGLELAWVADPVKAFFLAIQGSGRVRLADGSELRVGYAGQNGRDYTGIGRLLRERGVLAPGQATMEGLVAWLHAHPDEGRTVMRENKSYVFFREVTGPGPVGALGVALTPRASVAADSAFLPLGAPVFLATRTADGPLNAVMVAQDTGGAIKGANRFDLFLGAGADARRIAGGLSAEGRAWLLLPRATAERLRARAR